MKYVLAFVCMLTAAFAQQLNLMPLPAKVTRGQGAMILSSPLRVVFSGYEEPRLHAATDHFLDRLSRSTGIPSRSPVAPEGAVATLQIRCDHAGKPVQTLGEDESYTLTIAASQARLEAPTPLGILHGLETFLQLVEAGPQGYTVPAVTIEDRPRFPWRGLHIDVSRHWMPESVILRQLDAMAAAKLNVFHWHLTDDQGFRVESKLYPKLHEMGSDGNYYTQAQVKQVIAYARDRGIRVVPEFDMPGHTTAWFVGMPELASGSGPYQIERTWGIFKPTMDPTRESTYKFLDGFVGEMARLFPDEYFHIGGDEVPKDCEWSTSERIQAFMKQHGLADNDALQAYFNKRLQAIVSKHGKRMEGWDEILSPELPKNIVIQSWRGVKSLSDAAKLGFQGILSAPYYLDHMEPTEKLYLSDPLAGPDAASLNDEQRARILGGEVCSWDEYVTPENIDGRLWPRTAAVAERFWSPADVTDVPDMFRRLAYMERRLGWFGIERHTNYRTMLQRLSAGEPIGPLETVANLVRPVPLGGRENARKYTQQTPLNRLVDTALPDSPVAREFAALVAAPPSPASTAVLRRYLTNWQGNDARLKPTLEKNILLEEVAPVSAAISRLAGIGLQALDSIEAAKPAPESWVSEQRAYIAGLTTNRQAPAEVVILIADPVATLVNRAATGGAR